MPFKDAEKRRQYDRKRKRRKRAYGDVERLKQKIYDISRDKTRRAAARRADRSIRPQEYRDIVNKSRLKRIARSNGIPPDIGICYACAAAGKMQTLADGKVRYTLNIDHCHRAGDVNRGWLCKGCNVMEGFFFKGNLGHLASIPKHLEDYLSAFGNGWHSEPGLRRIERLREGLVTI